MLVQPADFRSITYPVSNESIEAIMAGLDLQPSDSVLCVGGSGDAGFACLERAGFVRLVDDNPAQVAYVRWLRDALAAGDYGEFLHAPVRHGLLEEHVSGMRGDRNMYRRRSSYFAGDGCLEGILDLRRIIRIRANLGSFIVERGDVFSASGTYSKVYLSNALGYQERRGTVEEGFCSIAGMVAHGGLVYLSNAWILDDEFFSMAVLQPGPLKQATLSSAGFSVDRQLSERAQSYETYWRVGVLRKA